MSTASMAVGQRAHQGPAAWIVHSQTQYVRRPVLSGRPCGLRASPRRTPCRRPAASAVASQVDDFNPQVVVVLGSQWGDEGKGKLVDILAQKYEIVARAQVSSGLLVQKRWGRSYIHGSDCTQAQCLDLVLNVCKSCYLMYRVEPMPGTPSTTAKATSGSCIYCLLASSIPRPRALLAMVWWFTSPRSWRRLRA